MLRAIPAPLHRQLYRIADRLRRMWWRVRKPRRNSAHVVAFDEAGRVLLVRHSYGRPVWALPGGGMERDEDGHEAAKREFREELACDIAGLIDLDPQEQDESGSHDMKHVFAARLVGEPAVDQREIIAVEMFDPGALPPDRGRYVEGWVRKAVAAWAASSQQR